jgi:hypothetical protein
VAQRLGDRSLHGRRRRPECLHENGELLGPTAHGQGPACRSALAERGLLVAKRRREGLDRWIGWPAFETQRTPDRSSRRGTALGTAAVRPLGERARASHRRGQRLARA